MPNVAFLTFGAVAAGGAWLIQRRQRLQETDEPVPAPPVAGPRELSWDDVAPVDPLGLEVGYRLISLVDNAQDGKLMARIKGVRRKLTQELGFLIPPVHIRDNLELAPNAYRLSLLGVTVGEGEVRPERELAINPGEVFGEVRGEATVDPVFGLQAVWIDPSDRHHAETQGYTVVDASTIIATHLSQLLQTHGHDLLGHAEVQQLLDRLSKTNPKLVEDLVPKQLPLGVVVKTLQNLLREGVPIRDLRTIIEALAERAPKSQDPDVLTAAVRIALGRFIVQHINGLRREIPVITLDPRLDQILQQALRTTAGGPPALEPGLAERLYKQLAEVARRQEMAGEPATVVVSDSIRALLSRIASQVTPGLRVLAFGEIPDSKQLRIVASIGRPES